MRRRVITVLGEAPSTARGARALPFFLTASFLLRVGLESV